MDVSKCHACHANSRGVPAPHLKPSAPPEPAQCHKCHTCHARVEVDVTKYHTSHVKRRWMFHDVSKCHACRANSRGVPAPHLKPGAPPEPAQCHKCHTCHARVSCVTTSCVWAPGVMTSCVCVCEQVVCVSKLCASTTPATCNEDGCLQVPRLPCQQPRRPGATPKIKRTTRASPVP